MNNLKINTKFSNFQIFVLVVLMLTSPTVFSLNRLVAETAGADGWISIIISGLIISLESLIIIKLCSKFPRENIFSFSKKIVGTALGTIINIFYMIYNFLLLSVIFRLYIEILFNSVFRKTPKLLVIIMFLIIALYACAKSIIIVGRVAEICFLLLLLITLLNFTSLQYMDINNLLPIGTNGINNILLASIFSLTTFMGLYVVLIFIPEMEAIDIKNIIKQFSKSIAFVISTLLISNINDITVFGVERTKSFIWPHLKYISVIHSEIFERIDITVIIVWFFIIMISIFSNLHFSLIALSSLFKIKNIYLIVIIFIINIPLILMYKDYAQLITFAKIINYISLFPNFIIPSLLLIINFIYKRGKS